MPEFGQCSDPSCNELAVRLFHCVHHCMKLVCLQHLIEHDRLMEHNQEYLNELRLELQQLWTTYSLLVDETKLRLEFEQKLKKHQQLIRDISHVFEINSLNIEHYRLMVEKLKQNIEQEKQFYQDSIVSLPQEEQVKNEPIDRNSTTDELGKKGDIGDSFVIARIFEDALNMSVATRTERLHNDVEQAQAQLRKSISDDSSILNEYDQEIDHAYESSDNEGINNKSMNCSSTQQLFGECPFWYDGAFGLTKSSHGMYLCPHKKKRELYSHLVQFHKLTASSVKKICQAIKNEDNPLTEHLFQSTDIVIDQINQYQCPFSIHTPKSTRIPQSSERPCRMIKRQLAYTLHQHLIRGHQMSKANAKKIITKLKANSKDVFTN